MVDNDDKKNLELAVLFTPRIHESNLVEFVPSGVVQGYYSLSSSVFIDTDNNIHFYFPTFLTYGDMELIDTQFYGFRNSILDLQNIYPDLSVEQLEDVLLSKVLKNVYLGGYGEQEGKYLIRQVDRLTGEVKFFEDVDSILFENMQEELFKVYDEFKNQDMNEEAENEDRENYIIRGKKKKYNFNPYELAPKIKSKVFGQDEAIDRILQSLWGNYAFIDEEEEYNKENILVIGPTGVGKTEIFRRLEQFNEDIVVHIADLASITEAGYVGDSLPSILLGLLTRCVVVKHGYQFLDADKFEHAIIVLDEFDKIAFKNTAGHDVGNRPVQEELLKMIEGKDYAFNIHLNGAVRNVTLSTKKITFVCCGAFEGINKRCDNAIGINRDVTLNNTVKKYAEVTDEDIVKYGYLPELIGRLPAIVTLNELTLDIFIKLIKSSKKTLFVKKLNLLQLAVEEVLVEENLYPALAQASMKLNKGARGIDKVSTDVFFPILQEAGYVGNYSYAKIDEETVANPQKYVLRKKG